MPTLVVNIGPMPRQLTLDTVKVACSFEDEMRYSSHIGQEALLAYQIIANGPAMIFARATLARFASDGSQTMAVFTGPKTLPDEVEIPWQPEEVFALAPDQGYWQPAVGRVQLPTEEAGAFFTHTDILGQIAAQVRSTARNICSFSGVEVAFGQGLANPIRPLALGGQEHVHNFIYLHDEPARLFNNFAWTVGPDFEIIADAYAMTTSVLATVNASGKLLVSDHPRERPDERALAWHREQFMQRLR